MKKLLLFITITLTGFTSLLAQDFYLNTNGITCMCPDAAVGDTGVVNGINYTKRTKEQITDANASTTCTSGITDMSELFYQLPNFNSNIASWDVSNVTDMYSMFRESAFNQDINSWDVSSVTDMSYMFRESPFNQDISSWDVSNVANMRLMFRESPFNQPIGNWDVSSVTNMNNMFRFNEAFNQPIGNWDVSSVTDMSYMFGGSSTGECIFNQPIGDWDVSSVTNMTAMLKQTPFNQDISSWLFNSAVNLVQIFDDSDLSVENYDLLLGGMVAQDLVNKEFGDNGLSYCNIQDHDALINEKGWIFGGGLEIPTLIIAPISVVVEVDQGSCIASGVELGSPTAASGCGNLTITNNAPIEFPIGITEVIWTLVDGNGVESIDTQTVTVPFQVDVADVCYVSSDQSQVSNNRIFISNDPTNNGLNVDYYEVLREAPSGDYETIGFITPPEVSFLDTDSDNTSQAYRYKIRTTDICGANYPESSFHKTILLQSGIASDNSINLSWTPYLGLDFSTYNIFKNTNGTGYELLTSLSFNNTTYNDTSANVEDNFYEYYISIEVASCDNDPLLPFSLRSNLELVNQNLSINNNNWLCQKIQVYPNPTSDYINISFTNQIEINTVSIYNALGQLVFDTNKFENIYISELSAGLYYLSINTNKGVVNKTMVRE